MRRQMTPGLDSEGQALQPTAKSAIGPWRRKARQLRKPQLRLRPSSKMSPLLAKVVILYVASGFLLAGQRLDGSGFDSKGVLQASCQKPEPKSCLLNSLRKHRR